MIVNARLEELKKRSAEPRIDRSNRLEAHRSYLVPILASGFVPMHHGPASVGFVNLGTSCLSAAAFAEERWY